MFCPQCGNQIDDNAAFCPHCGNKLSPQVQSSPNAAGTPGANGGGEPPAWKSPKSWVTTLILEILLGVLGIHRFYVGKIGTGVIWLLTAGLVGIGWLVDLIRIILGKFKDKQGRVITYRDIPAP